MPRGTLRGTGSWCRQLVPAHACHSLSSCLKVCRCGCAVAARFTPCRYRRAATFMCVAMQAGDFSKRSTRLYEQRWMELFGHDFKLVGGPVTPALQPACLAGCCTAAAGQLPCGWALHPAPLTPAATLHSCCTVNASISLPSVPEGRVADLAPSPPCLVLTPVLRVACSPPASCRSPRRARS